MSNYDEWNEKFQKQNLFVFNNNPNAILWLKTRAVCRGNLLKRFLSEHNINLVSNTITKKNIELFAYLEANPNAMQMLDQFLRNENNEWYKSMGINEDELKQDLYRIKTYAWGGDYNNSLDKHLVSKYVKTISKFSELNIKQNEIAENAWNYVQTSWYNNWTSYLIEALFKRHQKVVSAVGEIKSVDFFIDEIPIDLKVTYFPNQFMAQRLKENLGYHELTWLKREAKDLGISISEKWEKADQLHILKKLIVDSGHQDVIDRLNNVRQSIIRETKEQKKELMKWLYESQGEMRFGAENRLFLILVDSSDMEQSWEMKRNFNLIEPTVKDYLDNFNVQLLHQVDFKFKNTYYQALSDIIFIVK